MTNMSTSPSKQQLIVSFIFLFIFALVFRLSYVLTLDAPTPIRGDAEKYFNITTNLNTSGIYSHIAEAQTSNSLITPGYPLFLSLIQRITTDIHDFYYATLIIQSVLSALSIGLIFLIIANALPWKISLLMAGLLSLTAHSVTFSGYLLTETLFSFLLILSTYIAIRSHQKQSLALFSVFVILTILNAHVRPVVLLLPLFLVILKGIKLPLSRLKLLSLTLILTIITWAPWQIWQMQHKADNTNLFMNSLILGSYPDLTFKNPAMKGFPYREDPNNAKMEADPKFALEQIGSRISSEPLKYLKWYGLDKALMYLDWSILVGQGGPFVYEIRSSIYHRNPVVAYTLPYSYYLHYISLLGAFLFITAICLRKSNHLDGSQSNIGIILTGTIVYFTLFHIILAPLPRYSVPIHLIIYALACIAFYGLFKLVAHKIGPKK